MLVSRVEFIRKRLFASPNSPLKLRQSDIEKVKILARVVHRAFLANILTLRESAGFILKRIGDLYRTGYFNLSQDLAINRGQKVLLGACLVSFAQDSISEDEMIATVESFDVEKYNEIGFSSSGMKEEKEELDCKSDLPSRVYSSLESPLTFYIRDLRHNLRERQRQFLADTFFRTGTPESRISNTESAPTSFTSPTSPRGVMLNQLSKRLATDGTGFIDAGWELIIDRPDLRMWRRPSPKLSEISSGLYEYRVCGSFTDISARCFLEVQLNLEYRRQWDNSVVALESSRSTQQAADAAETEVIRWVARFPFPMARREYIYARRWWLTSSTPAPTQEGGIALIISRACNYRTKGDGNGGNSAKGSDDNRGGSGVEAQSEGGMVSVKAYESNMLIRSHGNIDEPGLDYFLVYYDDPQLILSTEAASRITSTVIPKLLEKLHDAALTISKQGLPDCTSPVVLTTQPLPSLDNKVLSSENPVETINTSSSPPSSDNSTSISFGSKVYRRFFGS